MSQPQAWVQLSAGDGPQECQRVIARLLPLFQEDAASHQISAAVVESVSGRGQDCLASVLFRVEGPKLDLFLASWRGSVQWRATSPFRPKHKRRNWFISIEVFDVPDEKKLGPLKVQVEAFRGSGPGGQNVNKVSSAVRLIHPASGLTVVAREERSQSANKKLALARLHRLLEEQALGATAAEREARRLTHHRLVRGNPVRTIKHPLS